MSPALRATCITLQCVPIPGVGAIIAGARNPHSRFLKNGIAQVALVIFGSYPLIIPGAAGLIWAVWDAVRIAQWSAPAPAWSRPTPDADPATLVSERDIRREERRIAKAERQAVQAQAKAERAEAKAAKAAAKAHGKQE